MEVLKTHCDRRILKTTISIFEQLTTSKTTEARVIFRNSEKPHEENTR